MDDMRRIVTNYIESIRAEQAKAKPSTDALAHHLIEAATILARTGDHADAGTLRAMAERLAPRLAA